MFWFNCLQMGLRYMEFKEFPQLILKQSHDWEPQWEVDARKMPGPEKCIFFCWMLILSHGGPYRICPPSKCHTGASLRDILAQLVLEVPSLDQQHWPGLQTYLKCKFSETPNQKPWVNLKGLLFNKFSSWFWWCQSLRAIWVFISQGETATIIQRTAN